MVDVILWLTYHNINYSFQLRSCFLSCYWAQHFAALKRNKKVHVDLRDRIILFSSTHKNNSQKQKLLNYGTNGEKKDI